MRNRYLFPHGWKPAGWVLLTAGLLAGAMSLFADWQPRALDVQVIALYHTSIFSSGQDNGSWLVGIENNIADELAGILIIAGAVLVAFCKVKTEDEYISQIRQESLVWAFYAHYSILLVTMALVYELTFYFVMVITMFTPLLIFILRFHWALFRLQKRQFV